MGEVPTWEMILAGILVVLVLFWIGPGIKATIRHSREAQERDWMGFLIPLAAVVLFVMLLIALL